MGEEGKVIQRWQPKQSQMGKVFVVSRQLKSPSWHLSFIVTHHHYRPAQRNLTRHPSQSVSLNIDNTLPGCVLLRAPLVQFVHL